MHCNSILASYVINKQHLRLFFLKKKINKTEIKRKKIPLFPNRQMRKVKKAELIMDLLGPQIAGEQCPSQGPPTPCVQSFFWTKDTAFFMSAIFRPLNTQQIVLYHIIPLSSLPSLDSNWGCPKFWTFPLPTTSSSPMATHVPWEAQRTSSTHSYRPSRGLSFTIS